MEEKKTKKLSEDEIAKIREEIREEEEKKAFEKVCSAVGTTPKELESIEARKKHDEELVSYDVSPTIVTINGEPQPTKGVAPRGKVDMIVAAAGNMRNRLLKEKMGNTWEIHQLLDGTLQSKLVKTETAEQLAVS